MKAPTKVLLCVASLWATSAFGDAMPACPPGEKVVMNPVAPGAFHHAGGQCVKDPDYKPTPESPKPTPEQEATMKRNAIIADLEAKAFSLKAQADEARAKAAQAKGTPEEAAKQKAADELATQAVAAQKAVDDFLAKKPEPLPETKAEPSKAAPEAKTGGCAVSPESTPMGFLALLVGLVLLRQRRSPR